MGSTDETCHQCSGTGLTWEPSASFHEELLAFMRENDAHFSDDGTRVEIRCTLCSGQSAGP